MAFDIANPIGTGTDAELLAFTRAAIVQITMHGQAYTLRGRTYTRADLKELRQQVDWLEGRIAATGNIAGGKVNYAERHRTL